MFRYRLQQLFYGRYGSDQLNVAIIILAVCLSIINLFFHSGILYLLSVALLVVALLRTFSQNLSKRRRENEKFLKIARKFGYGKKSGYYQNEYYTSADTVQYKYFKCKNCKAQLRVPKGKGKITITCPKCRASFKGKS